MAKPAFPDVLKKSNWDKQKGLLGKMSMGETGIGAALDGMLSAYNAVPWNKVDSASLSDVEPDQVKKVFDEGRAVLNGPIEKARKTAIDLGRLAEKTAGTIKSPVLKSVKDYLTKMNKAAIDLSVSMRDETIEDLKKLEAQLQQFNTHAAEIKKAGEAYIANRKLAHEQMKALQALFVETRTKLNQAAVQAETLSKKGDATGIQTLLVNARQLATNAKNKYSKEGDVHTNPVQAKARGNIGKFDKDDSMTKYLEAYQRQSKGEFNAIMACVAQILAIETEFEAILAGIETSLDIAKMTSGNANKSLAEHQQYARDAAKAAVDAAGKVAEDNRKLTDALKRYPGLIAQAKDPKTAPNVKGSILSTSETTLGEIRRRLAVVRNGNAQVLNIQKRLKALPPNIQADAVVKTEMAKIDAVLKNFQLALTGAEGVLHKAEQADAELRQLIH